MRYGHLASWASSVSTGSLIPSQRARVFVAVVVAVTVLGGITLINRPDAPAAATGAAAPSRTASPSPGAADPDKYARDIAATIFGMDTRVLAPGVYRAMLLRAVDPHVTAEQRASIIAAVDALIPPEDAWAQMRTRQQWSRWSSNQVWIPASRVEVVTGGRAEPDWVLRNVQGVQSTHTSQGGHETTTSVHRTITIGMRCAASTLSSAGCSLAILGSTVVP